MFKRFNKVQSESESFLHHEIQQYSLQSRKIQCSDYLSNITSLQFHFFGNLCLSLCIDRSKIERTRFGRRI